MRLALVLAAVAALVGSISGRAAEGQRLPLGRSGLMETRETLELAPGVEHTRIVRGEQLATDVWTVEVAFVATRRDARLLSARLRTDGFAPRTVRVATNAPDDLEGSELGHLVRAGAFASVEEANALRDRLAAAGYTGLRVIYTGEDGRATSGPWVVNVLRVDPERFDGAVLPELGTEIVPGLERLSEIAARTDALAAINGGYFVIGAADGTPGDLAGLSVIDGTVVSEAVNGRTSLVLPSASGEGASIVALASRQVATASDGATRELDGLNRAPGLVRGCGGSGGDLPTESPLHDFTCTDASELVQLTSIFFGPVSLPGAGVEAVLDASGAVLALRESRGGPIPFLGSVLVGTGDAADWLREHARLGARIEAGVELVADGSPLAFGEELGVVNGGPRLLRGGEPEITAGAEGFDGASRSEFYYRFGVRRNPRTLAGITADGHLVLVAVDGRAPGHSVGASFEESALVLQALGAVDGVNLDGGGSTALTVGTALVNRPSDATGERPRGDAIVLLPD